MSDVTVSEVVKRDASDLFDNPTTPASAQEVTRRVQVKSGGLI